MKCDLSLPPSVGKEEEATHPEKSHVPSSPHFSDNFTGHAYDWKQVHEDLLQEKYSGVYGWDHAPYWGIAEKKAHVDLKSFYKKRSADEFYLPEWKELIDNPETQAHWKRIVTFDPLGYYGMPPTIASCKATLTVPELLDLQRDDVIVDSAGGIKCSKAAVCYAWNLPHLAERLGLSEAEFRDAMFKYSGNQSVLDEATRVFLPSVGGFTIYAFGDVRKIRDPQTEIAVRVHDECIGSDVFGSDICTCRPYLIFALRHAVECAQRGGVGIVVYYRKEGRSLGEVIKFRVYNARMNQPGGDRPETYFQHTESIAGIRDARFQTMMPDALSWLGISRIDWLLSMSSDKYDAIISAGIQVMQRVSLPDSEVPKSAWTEIDAKVASGYHAEEVDKDGVIGSLHKLNLIRERCHRIYDLAQRKKLFHWSYHEENLTRAIDYTEKIIRENYPDLHVPAHSRMRHFRRSVLDPLVTSWPKDPVERTRRLVDLCTVSVMLDAGAGPTWRFACPGSGQVFSRSEGIAQATLDMFAEGLFSSDQAVKCRVNSVGLANLKIDQLSRGFQVRSDNTMVGIQGRLGMMSRLGACLEAFPEYFGPEEVFRPGNVVDYVKKMVDPATNEVSVDVLWNALSNGLQGISPRLISGLRRGDVWMHSKLKNPKEPGSDLVPFHKLTQWLCFTIIDIIESNMGIHFTDVNRLTALAEYRNGGLLVDTGVLVLKDPAMASLPKDVGSELIVEWRAMTVVLIDMIAVELRKRLGIDLTMSQVLEGGTWRAGRQIAKQLRDGGTPPILIDSDGTVI